MKLPRKFPRRVTTGPLRAVEPGRVGLRGLPYNFRMTSDQASYAFYAAQQRVKAAR
jgi:hypothetical protein